MTSVSPGSQPNNTSEAAPAASDPATAGAGAFSEAVCDFLQGNTGKTIVAAGLTGIAGSLPVPGLASVANGLTGKVIDGVCEALPRLSGAWSLATSLNTARLPEAPAKPLPLAPGQIAPEQAPLPHPSHDVAPTPVHTQK